MRTTKHHMACNPDPWSHNLNTRVSYLTASEFKNTSVAHTGAAH